MRELHRRHVLGRGRDALLKLLSRPELARRIGVMRELCGGVLPGFRRELLRELRGGPVFGRGLVGVQRLHAGLFRVEHRDFELRAVRRGSVLGCRGLYVGLRLVCGGEVLRPGLDQVHAVRGWNGAVEQRIVELRGVRCGKVLPEHAAGSGVVRELRSGLPPRDDGRDELPGLLRGPVLERDRLGLSVKLRVVRRGPVRGSGIDGMHAVRGRELPGLDGLASVR